MKKYLFRFLTLAVIVPALASCAGQLEDNLPLAKKHTVYFSTVVGGQATRTGLTIDGNNVVPDWRFTDPEDVHVFEMDGTANAHLGTASSIDPDPNDNFGAHFKADIEEEITIIVTPPSTPDPDGDGAKVLRQGSKTFGAVVAKSKEVEGKPVFYIPAVQTPDAETLKDPGAEFLVGYSRDGYDAITLDEEGTIVDLYFDRVAALSRIGFTNFSGEDEKVISVKINSQSSMTGSVKASDISFGNSNSVSWTPDTGEGAGVLTLSYGEGADIPTDKPFYAYFVSMPGTFTINSIVVETDQYRYTKAYADGKDLTFDLTKLANLTMDLFTVEKEVITSNVWYKASMLEAGYDYIIVSSGHALKNNGSGNVVAAQEVEIVDNTISPEQSEGIIWSAADVPTSEPNNDGFVLSDYGKFTLTNGTEHLWRYSNNGTFRLQATSDDFTKYMIWNYDGEYLTNHSIYVSNGSASHSDYYAYYDNGWTISTTKTKATLFTPRPPQELSFDKESVNYDFDEGGEFEEPTLSAASGTIYGDVTYSSDNTDIATVDSESGAVTIIKAGTAVITATAAGNAKYQAAAASYTIVASTAALPTWYKAEEVENNGIYMVVSNGNALNLNGTSISTVSNNAFSGASFQYDADDNLKWAATVSSDGKFTLKSGSRYLSRSSGNIQTSSSSGASLSYDSENNYITTSGNSGTYYIYYDSGWKASTTKNTATLYTTNPPLTARNLKFTPETVTHDLATQGTDVAEPTLTGDKIDDVTYKVTSDPKGVVASINATTGAITLASGKTGTVVITASADKTNTFKAESISYTLKVIDSSIPTNRYTKVTSTADLEDGAQYILVYETASKAFKPILHSGGTYFTKGTDNALDVTISNGVIESPDLEDCHITLENGYYLYIASAGKYLYPGASGDSALGAEDKTSGHTVAISFSEGIVTIARTSDSSYHLYWSSSSYFSGISNTGSSYAANICLYKLDDGRQPQTLSFTPATATYDLADPSSFEKPSLSTAYGDVTYSSSDATIAEVDDLGNITGKKKGTVTITATAAGDNQYKPGSASYTLTVNDSSAPDKYYVLVTGEPSSWDGKYLIVNTATDGTGSALNGTSTASVTISGGKILSTSTIDGYALTVTSAGEVHPNQTDSSQGLIAYDIKFSDGNWLYWFSSKYKQTSEDQNSRHNKCTLYYDNGGVRLMSAGYNVDLNGQPLSSTPSKNYLYYQSSGFSMSSNQANARVQLYKLDDDGSNPGGGDDPEPQTQFIYTQITSVSDLTDGASYLIVSSDANGYNGKDHQTLFAGDEAGTAVAVSATSGTITGAYSNYEFVITKSGSDYVLDGPNGYVTGNSGNSYSRYIQVSSSQVTMSLTNATELSAATSGDGLVSNAFYFYYTKSNSKEVLYLNSDGKYKIGGSGRKYGVYLYKKVENP